MREMGNKNKYDVIIIQNIDISVTNDVIYHLRQEGTQTNRILYYICSRSKMID